MPETAPCPPWCDQVQCQEAMPDDRYHQRLVVLPAVYRVSAHEAGACDLAVALFTGATEPDDTWVALELGEDAVALTLSLETAQRLHRKLSVMLSLA